MGVAIMEVRKSTFISLVIIGVLSSGLFFETVSSQGPTADPNPTTQASTTTADPNPTTQALTTTADPNPTTQAPTTTQSTTVNPNPTTQAPTTTQSTTVDPNPTTQAPTTTQSSPVDPTQTTQAPTTTQSPTVDPNPTTQAPTTTQSPTVDPTQTTQAPTTTQSPTVDPTQTTQAPTTTQSTTVDPTQTTPAQNTTDTPAPTANATSSPEPTPQPTRGTNNATDPSSTTTVPPTTRTTTEQVLYPDYVYADVAENGSIRYQQTTDIPFPYFSRTATRINTKLHGYVVVGADWSSDTPPIGTGWPEYVNIIALYWTTLDIPVQSNSMLYILRDEQRLKNLTYSSPLVDYVKKVVNDSNFEPLSIIVSTWQDVYPNPAKNYSVNDKATFQLILATDSKFSYAIKNYQTVWRDALTNINGRYFVSADYSGENGTRVHVDIPKTTTGSILVKLFSSGTPDSNPLKCVQGALEVKGRLADSIKALPVCPCYLPQVPRDGWFEAMSSPSCYQSLLNFTSVQQKCCYNTYGLLIGNTTEEYLPIQVNPSGVTILQAFNNCTTLAPQLKTWFIKQFPSSSCSAYTAPLTAGIIGQMHMVTFDNNKYTFNGFGDFVLIRSENVEIQVRTKSVGTTSVTTFEAVAVRIGENSSSIQLYWQTPNPMWNFSLGSKGDVNQMSPYKIEQTLSSIKLVLPTFIITVSNQSDVLACSIQTNTLAPKSVGLLGSTNGNTSDDFRFKNGTLAQGPVEQLSGATVRDFAISWKLVNESESLFDYPGARSFATANNETGLTISTPTTTVNETLNAFKDANVKAMGQQLCGAELFCLQNYLTDSNNATATEVLQQATNISHQKEQSIITPPKFIFMPSVLQFKTAIVDTIKLGLENNMAANFSLVNEGFPNISGIDLNKDIFSWNVDTNLAALRLLTYPRGLKFYATNAANLSAVYVPAINLCLCELQYQCVSVSTLGSDNDGVGSVNVNNMLCTCGDKSGGRYCENKVDFCGNCYNRSTCNDTNYAYCGSCPVGYTGDGKMCDDADECKTNNGGCDQICTNKIGSFNCSCKSGYTWTGGKCLDVDECKQEENVCKNDRTYCVNLPGTFSCPCYGDLVGQNGTCIRAPYTFIGAFELADTADQKWSPSLTNKTSEAFKTLAAKVKKSATAALTKGGSLNKDNLYVEVEAFEEVRPAARRRRRDAAASNSHTSAKVGMHVSSSSVTADMLNKLLADSGNSTCNQSCQYGELVLLSKPPQVDSNASLCNYPQIHKCDNLTSSCVQSTQTTSCVCRPGFEKAPGSSSCTDINECAGNVSQICPETGSCSNTAGSYKCDCGTGKFWDDNTTKCVADGCSTMPCTNNGVCYTLSNPQQFACRCSYGWEGTLCEEEDSEAKRMKIAVICVSVILGVLCLVLLIILIAICIRNRRTGSDWTLENDSYTNSRYNDLEPLPRAKISKRPGSEMEENDQTKAYQRLNYGPNGEKQNAFGQHAPNPSSRNGGQNHVYENRVYEGDSGEQM